MSKEKKANYLPSLKPKIFRLTLYVYGNDGVIGTHAKTNTTSYTASPVMNIKI